MKIVDIDNKLVASHPAIDKALFNDSLNYRSRVVHVFEYQERLLDEINSDFGIQKTLLLDSNDKIILGYN